MIFLNFFQFVNFDMFTNHILRTCYNIKIWNKHIFLNNLEQVPVQVVSVGVDQFYLVLFFLFLIDLLSDIYINMKYK